MDDFRFQHRAPEELKAPLLGAVIGAFVGGSAYVAIGSVFEHFRTPPIVPGTVILSYGQQFGMLTVVAAGLGATCGIGATLILQSQRLASTLLATAACTMAGFIAVWQWIDQRARYAYDPSEWILFPPLLLIASAALATFGVVAATSIIRLCLRRVGSKGIPKGSGTEF